MGKIFQFPPSKPSRKKSKLDTTKSNTTPAKGPAKLTKFSWIGFAKPPALNAEFNVALLDTRLANFDDFDSPPPTCA